MHLRHLLKRGVAREEHGLRSTCDRSHAKVVLAALAGVQYRRILGLQSGMGGFLISRTVTRIGAGPLGAESCSWARTTVAAVTPAAAIAIHAILFRTRD